MAIPLTRRQRDAIRDASSDRLAFGSACSYELLIDGKDYTRHVEELAIPLPDGPAVVLEGRLLRRLPEGIERKPCVVRVLVGGERVTCYEGEIDQASSTGYRSSFRAATESRHAEDTPLGEDSTEDLSLVNAEPSDALYEVASRLGYRGVEIPRVARPWITLSGPDRFRWTQSVAEVYEEIRKRSGLVLEDTPLSVAEGRPERSVVSDEKPAWTFTEGVDFDLGKLVVSGRTEARYARVVAYRELPNGNHQKLAEAEVDNAGASVRQDTVYRLKIEDGEDALDSAREKAIELGDNSRDLSFPCLYPPFFLDRGEPVKVVGREITADGTWVRDYRVRLTGVAPDFHERSGDLKAVGTLVSEVFEEREAKAPGLRPALAVAPLGHDHLGRFRIARDVGWVTSTGTGLLRLDINRAREAGVELTRVGNTIRIGV